MLLFFVSFGLNNGFLFAEKKVLNAPKKETQPIKAKPVNVLPDMNARPSHYDLPFRNRKDSPVMSERVQYAVSDFTATLGCKMDPNDEKSILNTEPYIWEIGSSIQRGDYSLDDFMIELEKKFVAEYKPRGMGDRIFGGNKHLDPQSEFSTDLNVSLEDRKIFLDAVRDFLNPFDNERKKHASAIPPEEYRLSFQNYLNKLVVINAWKAKFPNKMNSQKHCSYHLNNMETPLLDTFKKGLAQPYASNANPPLDVAARAFVGTLGCGETYKYPAIWYIGERINRGLYPIVKWNEAVEKELQRRVDGKEISKDTKLYLGKSLNEVFDYFRPETKSALSLPYNTPIFSEKSAIYKNYGKVRSHEALLSNWLTSTSEKIPCDSIQTDPAKPKQQVFEDSQLRKHLSVALDNPDPVQYGEKNACTKLFESVKEEYTQRMAILIAQLNSTFYDAQIYDYDFNPEKISREMQSIEGNLLNITNTMMGTQVDKSQEIADKYYEDNKAYFSPLRFTREGVMDEQRFPSFAMKDHIDNLVDYWKTNFVLGGKDPTTPENQADIDKYFKVLLVKNSKAISLTALESNGRFYSTSKHGDETSEKGRLSLDHGDHDTVKLLKWLNSKKNLQEESDAKRNKAIRNKDANIPDKDHYFTQQTNWGAAQISYDQSSVRTIPGQAYHENLQNILGISFGKDESFVLSESYAKANIVKKCQLKSLLRRSVKDGKEVGEVPQDVEADVDEAAKKLLEAMVRSEDPKKYQFLPYTWEHSKTLSDETKYQSVMDFALIQMLCPPVHLQLAADIYDDNQRTGKQYYGSLTRSNAIASAKPVAEVDDGKLKSLELPILKKINEQVKSGLMESYKHSLSEAANLAKSDNNKSPVDGAEYIKAQNKRYNELKVNRDGAFAAIHDFQRSKSDTVIQNYMDRLQNFNLSKPMSMFETEAKFSGWNEGDVTEYNSDEATGLKIANAYENYVSSTEKDKDKYLQKYREAQKVRRNKSTFQLSSWFMDMRDKYPNLGTKLDSAYYHFKDTFQSLHDLYDEYELKLADQDRQCRMNLKDPSHYISMMPDYLDSPFDKLKDNESKKTNKIITPKKKIK